MSDVDRAGFRRAAGRFPGGIVVVTTSAGHAMTVSAFASVSLEPPLVLFCAEKIARFHDAVLAAGSWGASFLAEDGEKTARWLATRGRPLDGQLDGVAHHAGPVTGAPLLDGALATLECRTTAVYDGGDHSIIVGEVVAVDGPAGGRPALRPAARWYTTRAATVACVRRRTDQPAKRLTGRAALGALFPYFAIPGNCRIVAALSQDRKPMNVTFSPFFWVLCHIHAIRKPPRQPGSG